MTAQEIKDLIASKIAGQGSAVDAGSALPEILNGIIDSIPEGGEIPEYTSETYVGGVKIVRLDEDEARILQRSVPVIKVDGVLNRFISPVGIPFDLSSSAYVWGFWGTVQLQDNTIDGFDGWALIRYPDQSEYELRYVYM